MYKRLLGVVGTLALSMLPLSTAAADVQQAPEARQTTSFDTLSSADKKFILDASAGGLAEVELGQLAKETAQTDGVKKFGQRMVDDHNITNMALTGLAAQKGMTVPSGMSPKYQALKARFSRLSGIAFDKEYMRAMVSEHEADVAAFQREINQGQDVDLTNWARSMLPTLQSHLVMARDMEATVNKGKQLVTQ